MADTRPPPEIVLLDAEAAFYAARIMAACPDVVIHSGVSEAQVLPFCGQAQALIGMAHVITQKMIVAAKGLRWIQALTTGVDPLIALAPHLKNVLVTSARGFHGPQMSELAFLCMLSLSRDFPRMIDNQREARWERWPQRLLFGKTAVIVGVGAISEELGARCKAFGMRVIGVSARSAAPGFDAMVSRERLTEAAAAADFLIALVPYTRETRHIINAEVLDAMKPTAYFLNLARGPVVDDDALIARLRSKRIAGAALDVFTKEPLPQDSPYWGMENVIVTSHIGGMSDIYAEQALPLVIANVKAFAAGRDSALQNLVTL